jgi:hypothetical protein
MITNCEKGVADFTKTSYVVLVILASDLIGVLKASLKFNQKENSKTQ